MSDQQGEPDETNFARNGSGGQRLDRNNHPARIDVEVTPFGRHEGEFCRADRALIFEDPDGTRILYDTGRTVRGPEDEWLGEVDAVLLSHVHGDHLGDAIQSGPDAGTCAESEASVDVTPNSNGVNIVVAKNARFLVGGEMASFFQRKVAAPAWRLPT